MLSSILVLCAVLVSLAAGVLLAHGLCVSMFQLFRIHSRHVAARRSQPATAAPLRVLGS